VLLANGAVLGHVASGLAHEPDGSAFYGLGLAGANEDRIGGGHERITVAFLEMEQRKHKAFNTEGTGEHRVERFVTEIVLEKR
jgi:hypothetical protein